MANRTGRPNVVVFFTDQQRWDSTGVHGNPLDLTPNFDRMALAAHLYNAYTCQPVCGPARAQPPDRHVRLRHGCMAKWPRPAARDLKTLAHGFGEAGYRTGYIGKWHLAGQTVVPKQERGGYEYWLGANCTGLLPRPIAPSTMTTITTPSACRATESMPRPTRPSAPSMPTRTRRSSCLPRSSSRISRTVWIPAPDAYEQRYQGRWIPPDLAALGGSTHQHLEATGACASGWTRRSAGCSTQLKSLDILDNTIVLFTSDHGCHFKTRNSEYKRSCHESSIRIPTALCGPGFDGGGQVRHMVNLVDLPPTRCSMRPDCRSPTRCMAGRCCRFCVASTKAGRMTCSCRSARRRSAGPFARSDGSTRCMPPTRTAARTLGGRLRRRIPVRPGGRSPYELNNLIGLESHGEAAVMRTAAAAAYRRWRANARGSGLLRPAKAGRRRGCPEEVNR